MPYTNIISRSEVQALIPEQVANNLLTGVTSESAALSLFKPVPMSTNQTRMPVLAALPTAYFVNGDTGLKQTTEVNWTNKYLNVEELAAIVPLPEAVLDDAGYDIEAAISPLLENAIGRALDAAIFFGTNKPASWPDDIVTAATAAGNTATRGTVAQAAGGVAGDISALMGTVEADGFDVNGMIGKTTYKGILRQIRDTTGQRVLDVDVANSRVDGVEIRYPMRGLWPSGSGTAEMIAGDFTNGIIAVRRDFTYKVLTEAVIQDSSGAIIYNLAQQDMLAVRVIFRVAFQVANTINYDQPTEASRYPFAVMLAA